MILNLNASMAEVTRLTRAGRLTEAMALLQGSPPKPKAPHSDDRRPMRTPSQIIDMMPPRSGTGAWTASGVHAQQKTPTSLAEGLGQPRMPEAMRGILDRLGKRGFSPGLPGTAGHRVQSAPVPDGARFEERTYANEAGSRTYKLYIP